MTEEAVSSRPAEPWSPRWRFFGIFVLIALVQLVNGWDDTDAIGLPVGFAATLVLVFVRRLPSWMTGERSTRSASPASPALSRLRVRRALALVAFTLVPAGIADGLIEHPPHGFDVLFAGLTALGALSFEVFLLVRLVTAGREPRAEPARPSRAAVPRRLRRRTVVVWLVLVAVVALVVTSFVASGGWQHWLLLPPALFAVLGALEWRSKVSHVARLLAAGPWTAVPAAVPEEDVWLGLPLEGWAVLPGGVRARFFLADWPADVGAELLGHRRLWVAGEPGEGEVAVGLPDSDTFGIGVFTVRSRDLRRVRKNTVPPSSVSG